MKTKLLFIVFFSSFAMFLSRSFGQGNFTTVLSRKERHAGISEGDHFHENGLMVL